MQLIWIFGSDVVKTAAMLKRWKQLQRRYKYAISGCTNQLCASFKFIGPLVFAYLILDKQTTIYVTDEWDFLRMEIMSSVFIQLNGNILN